MYIFSKCCNRVDISIKSKILKHAIRKYNISKCEYTIEYNTSPRIYQFYPFSQKYPKTFKFTFSCENSHLPNILRKYLISQMSH